MVDTVEIPALDSGRMRALRLTPSGRIGFDDRGNAVYEWQPQLRDDGADADERRAAALDHPGLAIIDDGTSLSETAIRRNTTGLRVGYNPYESGRLEGRKPKKPADMRKLSRWIELKRKLAARDE